MQVNRALVEHQRCSLPVYLTDDDWRGSSHILNDNRVAGPGAQADALGRRSRRDPTVATLGFAQALLILGQEVEQFGHVAERTECLAGRERQFKGRAANVVE